MDSKGMIDAVSIDVERSDQIIKVLDAAVILLEGGNELDLKSLDDDFVEEKSKEPDLGIFAVEVEKAKQEKEKEKEKETKTNNTSQPMEEGEESRDGNEQMEEGESKPEIKQETEGEIKQESEEEPGETKSCQNGEAVKTEDGDQPMPEETNEPKSQSVDDEKSHEPQPRPLHKTTSIFLRNLAPNITKQEVEAVCSTF